MQDDDVTVTFGCPTIAPKVYVAKGPSGWPETFKREVADRALASFISPVDIGDLVDAFVLHRETADKKEPTTWYIVVGYLSRTMAVPMKSVPHDVGVAFWARVVLAGRTSSTVN